MSESVMQDKAGENWKTKILILGGMIGALVGVVSAYLFIQNRIDKKAVQVTPGEGVKLGVLVLGLLRSIASLGEGK